MYAYTHIYIYTYISQHVDPPNINALCMGGGTRWVNVQHDAITIAITVKTELTRQN